MATLEPTIPALRRYAATLLRNRQEADNLVYDCLVRALAPVAHKARQRRHPHVVVRHHAQLVHEFYTTRA